MTARLLAPALALVVAACLLSACGRAGKPDYPEGTTYPMHYPDPSLSPSARTQMQPPSRTNQVFVDPSVQNERIRTPLSGMNGESTGNGPIDQGASSGFEYSPLPTLQPPMANPTP